MTAERLLTKAYTRIAEAGLANNKGPDPRGTQMLAVWADVQLSTSKNDVVRVNQLLDNAQRVWGA